MQTSLIINLCSNYQDTINENLAQKQHQIDTLLNEVKKSKHLMDSSAIGDTTKANEVVQKLRKMEDEFMAHQHTIIQDRLRDFRQQTTEFLWYGVPVRNK